MHAEHFAPVKASHASQSVCRGTSPDGLVPLAFELGLPDDWERGYSCLPAAEHMVHQVLELRQQ